MAQSIRLNIEGIRFIIQKPPRQLLRSRIRELYALSDTITTIKETSPLSSKLGCSIIFGVHNFYTYQHFTLCNSRSFLEMNLRLNSCPTASECIRTVITFDISVLKSDSSEFNTIETSRYKRIWYENPWWRTNNLPHFSRKSLYMYGHLISVYLGTGLGQ